MCAIGVANDGHKAMKRLCDAAVEERWEGEGLCGTSEGGENERGCVEFKGRLWKLHLL